MTNQRLRFGVNYVPSKNWWYSWLDWDSCSIADDLKAIAQLGMDHIRIQLLWPLFQPNPTYLSTTMFKHLKELLDIADEYDLDVVITVLDGWLSGFAFRPDWLSPTDNIFTTPYVVAAEKLLFEGLSGEFATHPRFLGFDIGNELGVMQTLHYPVNISQADKWQREILEWCEQLAPGKLHVNGVDHMHWFSNSGFSRKGLASTGAVTTIHAWIKFTRALDLYGPLGIGSLHLAEYLVELAKAYHQNLDRKVWLQEFGASAEWMESSSIPDFAVSTIKNVASCEDLWGCTWWCSHDVNRNLAGFNTLEYDLGLLDCYNRVKPVGYYISEIIKEFRINPPVPIQRKIGLVLTEDLFKGLQDDYSWDFGKAFMSLIAQGVRPGIILESHLGDETYLKKRGISEFVRLNEVS